MQPEIVAFLDEIRTTPEFRDAAAKDPVWPAHVEKIEVHLGNLYEQSADDAKIIDLLDDLSRIVTRKDTFKERLAAFKARLIRARVGQQ